MQITLCSRDMRRIVKGLYLVGKKCFFISKKKKSRKVIKNTCLKFSWKPRRVKPTAVQCFREPQKKVPLWALSQLLIGNEMKPKKLK